MTPDKYKAAAQAISDFILILCHSIYPASVECSMASQKRIAELSELRDALEAEGMK